MNDVRMVMEVMKCSYLKKIPNHQKQASPWKSTEKNERMPSRKRIRAAL
jgi:hypothetical protein